MRRRFLLSVTITDLSGLVLSFAAANWLLLGSPYPWSVQLRGLAIGESVVPFGWILLGSGIAASLVSARTWVRSSPRPSYGRAFGIVAMTGSFAAIVIALVRPFYSNSLLGTTLAIWLGLAITHRALRRRRPWSEAMIVITEEKQLIDDLRNGAHADVVAVYDPSGEPPDAGALDGATLVVDLRPVLSDTMAQFVSSWDLAGLPVRSLVPTYEEHTGRMPIVHLAEGWELTAPVSRNDYANVKRALDVFLVTITAPLWLSLGAVLWAAVRLDSRGAAIYRQARVGKGGKLFVLYKFRTMIEDAERDGPQFATADDSRLTRTGRWLRRFRIDEVPQLWNVAKGDLSLVGPRPERPVFTAQFERTIPFYRYRHLVRPGVTGWAQVNYGYADGEASTVDKLTYDLFYVKHMSPWLDAQILGKSVWTVLSGFGAQ